MNIGDALKKVDLALGRLSRKFIRNPALILTESDLKCLLFSSLATNFLQLEPTADGGILGTALHTELSWFNGDNHLRYHPDISIIDPQNLSIIHGAGDELPRKGARFFGSAILIELKFCHEKSGVSQSILSDIQADFLKLRNIAALNNDTSRGAKIFGRVVLFSRYSPNSDELAELERTQGQGDIQLRVISGRNNAVAPTARLVGDEVDCQGAKLMRNPK